MRLLTLLLCTVLLAACNKSPQETRKIKMYQSPMHPWITSDKPGNCTICGMQLVPVYEGEEAMSGDKNLISLHDSSVAALSVATAPVQREMMTKNLRFTGILEDDENIHRVIAAFYDGRIDRVYVQHVGEYIEKGKPLAAIYSRSCSTSSGNTRTPCGEGTRRWRETPPRGSCSMGSARSNLLVSPRLPRPFT